MRPALSNGGGDWGRSNSSAGAGGSSSAPVAQNPAFGAPVHADAPTGMIAPVSNSSSSSSAAAAASTSSSTAGRATTTFSEPTKSTTNLPSPGRSRGARNRGPRRARLQLRHINPWTVLKFSCVLSIALFFVWLIVVGILFGVLDAAGVIGQVNDTVIQLNGPGSKAPVTAGIVFGGAAIIGVVNIVLFIALSTIGSVVYNLCADLVGGIEITLSER